MAPGRQVQTWTPRGTAKRTVAIAETAVCALRSASPPDPPPGADGTDTVHHCRDCAEQPTTHLPTVAPWTYGWDPADTPVKAPETAVSGFRDVGNHGWADPPGDGDLVLLGALAACIILIIIGLGVLL